MNVSVRHNGNNISSYVVSYEREHKICTGIGQLNITIAGSIGATFEPWDEIDIYENGSFRVRYYVSSITASKPSNTIILECQDMSKRLVDYFIPDQYTIDYLSYTGYWIKKFLDEAGINYQFLTNDTGVLLSNYTSLGLQPAYEQIMNLLQLSGWYMYFDGNGVAKIGSLMTELSSVQETLNKNKILSISKVSDDKMLRNRAVVWGAFDPLRREYAYADISTTTAWNYDSRDKRAMVVSNSNIPNKSSAYGIANKLLKEFSRITVEKHIQVHGASNRDLGEVVRVRSDVYNGTGMITTFGVTMSKSGLTSNLVLDERCPRLFGFFDFGDYVYVGTFGSGVWRKHIRFDHTWRDFSTGIIDLAITDLHINNETFGAIASSGDMYYATETEGPWYAYQIESLMSSVEDQVDLVSGVVPSGIEMMPFSGLMGRAVIVDKLSNTLKYGIDNASGLNYGDYFLDYSGLMASGITQSGVSSSGLIGSGGYRGWIVEYDPFTAASGVYPISVSGNFDIQVIDLENDGINDYVSVKQNVPSIEGDDITWNYGRHTSQPYSVTNDANGFAITSEVANAVIDNTLGFEGFNQPTLTRCSLIAYDNQISNEMEVVSIKQNGTGVSPSFYRTKIARAIIGDLSTSTSRTVVEQISSIPSGSTDAGDPIIGIYKIGVDLYRVYYWRDNATQVVISYQDWNAYTNTVDTAQTLLTENLEIFTSKNATGKSVLVVGDTAYALIYYTTGPNNSQPTSQTYLNVYVYTITLSTGAITSDHVLRFFFPLGDDGIYYSIPDSTPTEVGATAGFDTQAFSTFGACRIGLFQNGTQTPQVIGYFMGYHFTYADGITLPYRASSKEYVVTGSPTVMSAVEVDSFSTVGAPGSKYWALGGISGESVGNVQVTANRGFLIFNATNSSGSGYLTFNGTSLSRSAGSPPSSVKYSSIYPLLNVGDSYIASDSGNFYMCSANDLSLGTQITPPGTHDLTVPTSTPVHGLDGETFFVCYNNTEGYDELIPFANGILNTSRGVPISSFSYNGRKIMQLGCFFISEGNFNASNPVATVSYVDLLRPVNTGSYLLLQREDTNFHIIRQAAKPIRVDISNSRPILTVLDEENTFQAHYVYENELTTVSTSHTFLPEPSGVRDYRYTMLEVPSGIEVASGIMGEEGVAKLVLYAIGSGINYAGTTDLSSGFMQMYPIPSGFAERIETSNFVSSGQYVFVTTSGDNPDFFQKDPMQMGFTSYSGLPAVRATIIRLDDRF